MILPFWRGLAQDWWLCIPQLLKVIPNAKCWYGKSYWCVQSRVCFGEKVSGNSSLPQNQTKLCRRGFLEKRVCLSHSEVHHPGCLRVQAPALEQSNLKLEKVMSMDCPSIRPETSLSITIASYWREEPRNDLKIYSGSFRFESWRCVICKCDYSGFLWRYCVSGEWGLWCMKDARFHFSQVTLIKASCNLNEWDNKVMKIDP